MKFVSIREICVLATCNHLHESAALRQSEVNSCNSYLDGSVAFNCIFAASLLLQSIFAPRDPTPSASSPRLPS
jgi:hypothetical protein